MYLLQRVAGEIFNRPNVGERPCALPLSLTIAIGRTHGSAPTKALRNEPGNDVHIDFFSVRAMSGGIYFVSTQLIRGADWQVTSRLAAEIADYKWTLSACKSITSLSGDWGQVSCVISRRGRSV